MQIIQYNKDSITKVAEKLWRDFHTYSDVWAFRGDMGAGKTTLISALLQSRGYQGTVSSPTFSIVQEYLLPDDSLVYHMDWYRVRDVDELWEIGIEEYLDSPYLKLIEWPQIYSEALEDKALYVDIKNLSPETRELHIGSYADLKSSTPSANLG